jgi:hypothetical protein
MKSKVLQSGVLSMNPEERLMSTNNYSLARETTSDKCYDYWPDHLVDIKTTFIYKCVTFLAVSYKTKKIMAC